MADQANKYIDLPADKDLAGKVLDAVHAEKALQIGKIGIFFGSPESAKLYIAGIVAVVSLVFVAGIAIWEPQLRSDAVKGFLAIAATAIGFVFGSQASK